MKKFSTRLIALILLSYLGGCAEKQDFDQFDDLSITPSVEAALIYLEAPEQLINEAPDGAFFSQDYNFDAFEEAFIAENVLEGTLTYELENSTSKPLEVIIEFLDSTGNLLDTELFTIDPGPGAILTREVAYGGASGRSLDILRNTSAIRVSGRNLGDTVSVSEAQNPRIILRSSARVSLRLK